MRFFPLQRKSGHVALSGATSIRTIPLRRSRLSPDRYPGRESPLRFSAKRQLRSGPFAQCDGLLLDRACVSAACVRSCTAACFLVWAVFRYPTSASQPWPGRGLTPRQRSWGSYPSQSWSCPRCSPVFPPRHPHLPFPERAASIIFHRRTGPSDEGRSAWPGRVAGACHPGWLGAAAPGTRRPQGRSQPFTAASGSSHRGQSGLVESSVVGETETALGFGFCRASDTARPSRTRLRAVFKSDEPPCRCTLEPHTSHQPPEPFEGSHPLLTLLGAHATATRRELERFWRRRPSAS